MNVTNYEEVGVENTLGKDGFNVTQVVCVVGVVLLYFLLIDTQCKYWSLYEKQESLHAVARAVT